MPKKKKATKPLSRTSMKKAKGGLLPAMGDGSVRGVRYSPNQADPPDPDLNANQGRFATGL